MKQKIYLMSLIAIILITCLIVFWYYSTANFTEELTIEDLTISEVSLVGDGSYPTENLATANANIGSITLKNNGPFTHTYKNPQFFGCIHLKEPDKVLEFKAALTTNPSPVGYKDHIYEDKIYLGPREVKTYYLAAEYSNIYYNPVSLSSFTKENIASIKVYKIKEANRNPFGIFDNYYFGEYYDLCSNPSISKELVDEIKIN